MRVFTRPMGLHSRAMVRVSNALDRHLPVRFTVSGTSARQYTDLVILHVIGYDAIEQAEDIKLRGGKYAVIQYCLKSTEYTSESDWQWLWTNAELVWSYYDLSKWAREFGFNFYYAPLGIDEVFIHPPDMRPYNRRLVITSGYVNGPHSEAIEEVWRAAEIEGIEALHIGPSTVEGMDTNQFSRWNAVLGLSDEELASEYRRATWVSGLRHKEGFEMPAIEGLACGVRPLLFDQPSQRHWYGESGVYVKDRSGDELINDLVNIFRSKPRPVSEDERKDILDRFNWQTIVSGFWERLGE